MERQQLVTAACARAAELGWTAVIPEDHGNEVQLLLGAEGAAEQEVNAPLSTLRRELSDLGGPENYPAIEEYDVIPEPSLTKQDGSWTEEAERLASPGELPAGPDGEDSPDTPHEEEAKENTMDMKELWRGIVGMNRDQDHGGIPDPIGKAKDLGLHEDPESAYRRPATVRSSAEFRVQGLNPRGRTLEGSAFSSGIYRDLVKAKRGYDGAQAAGLLEVRCVRLSA